MNMLETIQHTLDRYSGEIIFDSPVIIKSTPHQHIFSCYGIHLSKNEIWLLDGGGAWHGPLDECQINAKYVISSIYQRLMILENKRA